LLTSKIQEEPKNCDAGIITGKSSSEEDTILAAKSPELREVVKALIRGLKFTTALLEKVLKGEPV